MYKLVVWSGGQSGVDKSGLDAAKKVGLQTSGWMPKGFKTLDGSRPDYKELYGMQEHTGGYKDRTWANVRDSDGTVRIASLFNSAGEICTRNAIDHHKKLSLDIRADFTYGPTRYKMSRTIEDVANWIIKNEIHTLNVAGNSEQTAKGVYQAALAYLCDIFLCVINFKKE